MTLVRASLIRKDNPAITVPFSFNPEKLLVEKTNQFTEVKFPGLSSSIFNFVKGGSRTINLDLFVDTYEQKTDVRILTDRITGWSSGSMFTKSLRKGLKPIDSDLHAPPICLFVWGAFIFACIIERVSKRSTLFLPEGIPVKAILNVTLREARIL